MKTIIRTSVKDNENITVAHTVSQVHDLLKEKGSYILVIRVEHTGRQSESVLAKSTIKMVRTQKT